MANGLWLMAYGITGFPKGFRNARKSRKHYCLVRLIPAYDIYSLPFINQMIYAKTYFTKH